MKKIALYILISFIFKLPAYSAGSDALPPKEMRWKFEGVFGTVDRQSAQRGYKVFKNVCATCHSLKLLAYRNLADLGFSEAEIKAIAAEVEVKDGPNDDGEMFDRPGLPSDRFVSPYSNEKAARAANNGAYPPDLSLIVKARPNGANYIYSLLTGYQDPPESHPVQEGMYYNPYFSNSQIAMAPPLMSGVVEYTDGVESSVHQMSKDIVTFLQWASEPEMEQRKEMGIKVMLYLFFLTGFFIVAKEIVWRKVK